MLRVTLGVVAAGLAPFTGAIVCGMFGVIFRLFSLGVPFPRPVASRGEAADRSAAA